ncbi:MAG: DEAD/DEAH box helicase, partial [Bacteroidales bacterium]|nr:DEAD/DEAH box helicase [Bacteroidales bacterium]
MQTFKKEKVNFQDFDLIKSIQTALDELEYDQPTPIQIETYSTVRSGKDLVGVAQTGTGKTLAYLLPIVDWLSYSEQRMPRVIVMVPTRELVMQVVKEVEKITPYLSVRTVAVYGATNINTQKQKVYDGCDILVGTPGRVYDLIMSGILRTKDVKKFVIDEVDEMFNLGFRPQTVSIMETLPPKRQNLMFSATLSEDVENLVNKFFNKPKIVKIVPHGTPLEKIIQIGYPVLNFNTKLNLLVHLLKNEEEFQKVLVFVSTKKQADAVFAFIEKKHPEQVAVIHSNKSQNQRFNAVNALHDGKVRILIATDVVARGIDILDITHVINVDTPLSPGDYIHRIGRTGRADKPGT